MTSLIMSSASEVHMPIPVEKEVPVYSISDTSEILDEEEYTEESTVSEEPQEEVTYENEDSYNEEYEDYIYEETVTGTDWLSGLDTSFKAYMDYRCITDTSSVQYELQQQAYTDGRGFRRIGDDYCVALGTGITNGCGERFMITLDSGSSFTVIVSDIKSDCHTDSTCCYVPRYDGSGNVVEFIIDTDMADGGMLSSGNAGYYDDLAGSIASIIKL